MNNRNYVNKQEKICSNLLEQFNKQLKWFNEMNPNNDKDEYSIIDYTCIDKKGRKCHCELKQRNANIDDFPTIFLDVTKMFEWTKIGMSGFTNNEQRLYFNFMNDGVIIFDLNNISSMEFYPNHKQMNYAEQKEEHRDKWGLKINDAIVYKYNKDGTMTRVKNERYNKIKPRKEETFKIGNDTFHAKADTEEDIIMLKDFLNGIDINEIIST